MTRLTIAVPNYNGGKNLRRAIESCKKIKIPLADYEILIADNCSTDNSITVINELNNEFSNLVLIENKENVGRIQNWNVCLENAKGKFLIFLFSNDAINEQNNKDWEINAGKKFVGIIIPINIDFEKSGLGNNNKPKNKPISIPI